MECNVQSHATKKAKLQGGCLYISTGQKGQGKIAPKLHVDHIPDNVSMSDLLKERRPLEVWTAFFERATVVGEQLEQGSVDGLKKTYLDELEKANIAFKTPHKDLKLGEILAAQLHSTPDEKTGFIKVETVDLDEDDDDATSVQRMTTVVRNWNSVVSNLDNVDGRLERQVEGGNDFMTAIRTAVTLLQSASDSHDLRIQLLNARMGFDELKDGKKPLGQKIREMEEVVQELQAFRQVQEKSEANVKQTRKSTEKYSKSQIGVWAKSLEEYTLSDVVTEITGYPKEFLELHGRIRETEDDIGVLRDEIRTAALPSTPVRKANLTSETVTNLCSEVVEIRKQLKSLSGTASNSNVNSDLRALKRQMIDLEDLNLSSTLRDVKREMKAMREDLKDEIDKDKDRMQDIKERVLKLEAASYANGDDEDGENEMEDLSERIAKLEARVSQEGYTVDNLTFMLEVDAKNWTQKEGIKTFGFFWDLFSVLCVMGPKTWTGKERADRTYASQRVNATAFESDLGASMGFERPRSLFAINKQGDLSELIDGFGTCKQHKQWISSVGGYKTRYKNYLQDFCDAVLKASRNSKYDLSRKAKMLIKELVHEVKNQWNDLSSFIDSFYTSLTEVAHFPPKKVWDLVGRCVGIIFLAMRPYRSEMELMEEGMADTSSGHMLWTVLQCHRIFNEFRKVEFNGHPLIVKEITSFTIEERVNPEDMKKLSAEAGEILKENKQLRATIKSLEEKLATATRTLGNLANDIKHLKSKI